MGGVFDNLLKNIAKKSLQSLLECDADYRDMTSLLCYLLLNISAVAN